jgi:hypothetical protein
VPQIIKAHKDHSQINGLPNAPLATCSSIVKIKLFVYLLSDGALQSKSPHFYVHFCRSRWIEWVQLFRFCAAINFLAGKRVQYFN